MAESFDAILRRSFQRMIDEAVSLYSEDPADYRASAARRARKLCEELQEGARMFGMARLVIDATMRAGRVPSPRYVEKLILGRARGGRAETFDELKRLRPTRSLAA
jgi:hypothetical protein